ncbi:MAG: nuclear transport factor 2 family protein [Flavobacteriaceae bacterium]
MKAEIIVQKWFECWEEGNFEQLPIADDFKHTSPYGTIEGKSPYLEIVKANRDKFLGHRFKVHDAFYDADKVCVRYSAIKEDFRLEVSEWHYIRNEMIHEIIAYYNIEGGISEERKLEIPD